MDTYIAKKDCYYNGMFLKKGQTLKVAVGTVIEFKLLEKVVEDEAVDKKAEEKPVGKTDSKK
ncbi:MAG: hypothetical protein AB7S52_08940 [Sphaerochaetaceae bacterium]